MSQGLQRVEVGQLGGRRRHAPVPRLSVTQSQWPLWLPTTWRILRTLGADDGADETAVHVILSPLVCHLLHLPGARQVSQSIVRATVPCLLVRNAAVW